MRAAGFHAEVQRRLAEHVPILDCGTAGVIVRPPAGYRSPYRLDERATLVAAMSSADARRAGFVLHGDGSFSLHTFDAGGFESLAHFLVAVLLDDARHLDWEPRKFLGRCKSEGIINRLLKNSGLDAV